MSDYFLDKGNAAMDAALNGKMFGNLASAIKKPPFPPTPNKLLAVLIPTRIWAVKYGTTQDQTDSIRYIDDFFTKQDEFGHNTFGPNRDDCEQSTSNHWIQYSRPYTTGLIVGRRLKDDDLVDYCNLWFARELYFWNKVDHFKTGRVICAGARTRESPNGDPVCENVFRNKYWTHSLGRDTKNKKHPLFMATKEGWSWPLPIKPKFYHPLEIRYDVNQKRILTSTGHIAGSEKRGWAETDYIAGSNPSFKWPTNGIQYPILEII